MLFLYWKLFFSFTSNTLLTTGAKGKKAWYARFLFSIQLLFRCHRNSRRNQKKPHILQLREALTQVLRAWLEALEYILRWLMQIENARGKRLKFEIIFSNLRKQFCFEKAKWMTFVAGKFSLTSFYLHFQTFLGSHINQQLIWDLGHIK